MTQIDFTPSLSAEKVAIYSRDPKIAQYMEQRFLHLSNYQSENQNDQIPLALYQGKVTTLNLKVKAWEPGLYSTVINCIDLRDNKIIKSWLIEVDGKDTAELKNYQIVQLEESNAVHKFKYKNIFDEKVKLTFVSSKPRVLEIKGVDEDGSIEFSNNEEKEIEILIPTLKKEDTVKVYVYESNGKERICDTMNF